MKTYTERVVSFQFRSDDPKAGDPRSCLRCGGRIDDREAWVRIALQGEYAVALHARCRFFSPEGRREMKVEHDDQVKATNGLRRKINAARRS